MLNENRREGKSEPMMLQRTRGLLRKALQLTTVEKIRFCIAVLYSHVKSGSLASGQSWATMSSTVTRLSPQDAARAGAILMWKDIIEEFVAVNTSSEDDEELDWRHAKSTGRVDSESDQVHSYQIQIWP
jgi:hypothetical protein